MFDSGRGNLDISPPVDSALKWLEMWTLWEVASLVTRGRHEPEAMIAKQVP